MKKENLPTTKIIELLKQLSFSFRYYNDNAKKF